MQGVKSRYFPERKQRRQRLLELGESLASMTHATLRLSIQFCKSFAQRGIAKEGIISKAVLSFRGKSYPSRALAAKEPLLSRTRSGSTQRKHTDKPRPSLLLRQAGQIVEELLIVPIIIRRLAAVARRKNARRPAERIDFQPGIVRQRDVA